jgi:serine/threonine protein kinase/tetratricopeptide (TPR) repeat protein
MDGYEAAGLVGRRYQFLDKLGEGGMGIVFAARDRLTQQTVALKQIRISGADKRSYADTDALRVVLTREFQMLASLRHPQIISVLDYGFDHDHNPYFTMDLLHTPQTFLHAARPHRLEQKAHLLVQVLQALVYLHRRGILHRDLKPGNILVTGDAVKVLDFGLAIPRTEEAEFAGTIEYMAPEILQGEAHSEASDLFAVGVIAYEMFTGRYPFGDTTHNRYDVIRRLLNTEIDITPLRTLDMRLLTENHSAEVPTEASITEIFDTDPSPTLSSQTVLSELPLVPETVTAAGNDPITVLDRTDLPAAPNALSVPPDAVSVRAQTADAVSSSPKPTTELRFGLSAIIQKLLHRSPDKRYQDAAAVIRDLSAALGTPFPLETTATRESFLQAAQFIGRDTEMQALIKAAETARAGGGSVWLIAGESGVGKSRLLEEVRIQALVAGTLVVRGQAAGVGAVYQAWREPMRRLALSVPLDDTDAGILTTLVPDIAELLDRPIPSPEPVEAEEAQKRLFAVVISLLRRLTEPTVIILEDLHAAREDSLALLAHLAGVIANLPVLILGSYREEDRPDLRQTLDALHHLRLSRLTPDEIAALSGSIIGARGRDPGLIDMLTRETEGNVYFLVEVIRALAEMVGALDQIGETSLPQKVFAGGMAQVIQHRLGRAPESARPVLEIAAAFGRELDVRVLAALDPTFDLTVWLRQCADAAVIELRDERWQFTHDKLRDGLLDTLSADERSARHRRLAEALDTVYADAPQYALVRATHWQAAGDEPRERAARIMAGEYAYQIGDLRESIQAFTRALSLTTQDDPAVILMRIALARSYSKSGAYSDAAALLDICMRDAQTAGDVRLAAEAQSYMGRNALMQGKYPDARRHLDASLPPLQKVGDRLSEAETLLALAQVMLFQGDVTPAETALQASVALFRALEDRRGTAGALGVLADAAMRKGELDAAAVYLQDSLQINRELGSRNSIGAVQMHLGMIAFYQGDALQADAHFVESLCSFRETGEQASVAASLNNRGYLALTQRDYAAARAHFEESLAISRALGNDWGIANTLSNLGAVYLDQGAHTDAQTQFNAALAQAHSVGAVPLILEILVGVARLQYEMGDVDSAARLVLYPLHHSAAAPDVRATAATLADKLGGIVAAPPADLELTLVETIETLINLEALRDSRS